MESVLAATQLRNLLLAHDKAAFQIYALDLEVHSLMKKMTKQVVGGHIIHGVQLAQRRCVLEGVKEMFSLYRLNKWREVQACISTITGDEHQLHTDVSGEDLWDDSRTGEQAITSDSLSEDQHVRVEEHQFRAVMLGNESQRDVEEQQMQNWERLENGLNVWSQHQNHSQQHQDHLLLHQHQVGDHLLQHQHQGGDHHLQHQHQGGDHLLQHQHQGGDHILQHQHQGGDHLLQHQGQVGLLYWNPPTQSRVEEDMDNSFSSDNESSLDLNYEDGYSEDEEDGGTIYCHGSYNRYMVTITRGLCLESCELHRCA